MTLRLARDAGRLVVLAGDAFGAPPPAPPRFPAHLPRVSSRPGLMINPLYFILCPLQGVQGAEPLVAGIAVQAAGPGLMTTRTVLRVLLP